MAEPAARTGDAFARDLGYLDKFLQGLAAHAASLGPERGGRLKALIDEEIVRWREIRGLLGAGGGAPGGGAPPGGGAARASAAPAAAGGPPYAFTVGSLYRRPQK